MAATSMRLRARDDRHAGRSRRNPRYRRDESRSTSLAYALAHRPVAMILLPLGWMITVALKPDCHAGLHRAAGVVPEPSTGSGTTSAARCSTRPGRSSATR